MVAGVAVGMAIGAWFVAAHGAAHTPEQLRALLVLIVVPAAVFSMIAGGAAVFLFAKWVYPGDVRAGALAPVGVRAAKASHIAAGALAGILIALAYRYAVVALYPMPSRYLEAPIFHAVAEGGILAWAWIAGALVLAPLAEEFVFRGVLFEGFRKSWSTIPAGLIVTALFVLMHLGDAMLYPPAMLGVTAMGIAALAVRVRTDSLAPAMSLHAGYNFVVLLTIFGPFAPR